MDQTRFAPRRAAFRRPHESGCFIIPNPWDAGSARSLAALGFKALATTSSGHAWAHAQRDGSMPVEAVLAHCREIVAASPRAASMASPTTRATVS